ncbi:4-(cytidine 5'-diphospho)-2-C-methyl-D-erythritol kinase [Sulfobacillus thermosulfidooxidans]|uniref:4-(cytidine 5'-diphospho)-2-C-methyl-D-erythritol kinase n=1 Tax=Sulfobacillus thermosulfidooxidans TaxID=28034 RepID=UPI00237887C3|nr:4-(cytidine 5'-diphospho)-2-C-methyl-D-erythritol kinase [Sulfobacillus thermosulfidooxidans]
MLTQPDTWRLKAYAKINLGLWVEPRDARGYHPVRSLMQTIQFFDQIEIRRASAYHVDMLKGPGLPSAHPVSLPVHDNLVTKAYRLVRSLDKAVPTVHIRVRKYIPMGAGLGGGSADAASILRWAGQFMSAPLPAKDAAVLGMDVPFLVQGGTAKASGYGEEVEHLPPLRDWYVLLVSPNFGLSTRRVYEAFDALNLAHRPGHTLEEIVEALRQGILPDNLFNALEPAAWTVNPALQSLKETLTSLTSKPWFLTGSGSTYFTLLRDRDEALAIEHRLQKQPLARLSHIEVAEFGAPGTCENPENI